MNRHDPEAAARAFLAPYRGWTLYAGFSGGADSLALLTILHRLCGELDLKLTAVHCEHGIRGEASLADAAFCREFCAKRQIAYLEKRFAVPEDRRPGESVEAAARRLRQAVWHELAADRERTAVVLAHHAGDRRETLLLRLARGSGASGLAGLRGVRMLGGVRYLRPLLHAERAELEAYLVSLGVTDWRRDATNDCREYRRNFVRHELLAKWAEAAGTMAGLSASLDALEADARFLERLAASRAERLIGADSAAWRAVPKALRGRVLRLLARRKIGRDWIPGKRFLAAFERALSGDSPAALALDGVPGTRWRMRDGGWDFEAFSPVPETRRVWRWRADALPGFAVSFPACLPEKIGLGEAYFDAAALPEELLAASGADGDRMIPFGRKRPVKWKVLRIDRKVPRRAAPPLLRLPDGAILWSPLIRHSALAPVTAATREIVCFKWKEV